MGKSQPISETQTPAEPVSAVSEQTATAIGGAQVPYTDIPRGIYDEATSENDSRRFADMLSQARTPEIKPEPQKPPVPIAIAEQTRLEIEAGRKRNIDYQAIEAERLKIVEAHKNDRWADKPSESVFRPGNHVPDPKRPVDTRSAQGPMNAASGGAAA